MTYLDKERSDILREFYGLKAGNRVPTAKRLMEGIEAARQQGYADAIAAMRDQAHVYLSTSCLHDEHTHCQTEAQRYDGTPKVPATCKFCGAPCVCDCHEEEKP